MTTRKKSIKQRDNITNLKRFIMTRKLNKAKAKTLSNNRLNMSGGAQSSTTAEDAAHIVAPVIAASVANASEQQTTTTQTTQPPEIVAAVIISSLANASKQLPNREETIKELISNCTKLMRQFTQEIESHDAEPNPNNESKLLKIINSLLDNKRKLSEFEMQVDGMSIELFDLLTEAIQLYIKSINEIMKYLKKNFSMKYQWIEIVSLSAEDKKTIIDMQYKKGNYDKKTAIIDKLYKSSNNGMWTFDVWIPDKRGKTISLADEEGRNELDKKLKVKTKSGEIIDTFVTEPIILYSCRFIIGKKYDIANEVNYQPVIEDANDESLAKEGKTYTEMFRSYGREIKSSSKRSLREELKIYIGSIINKEFIDKKDPDKEFTNKKDPDKKDPDKEVPYKTLLKTRLRFEDTKQDIRTILVNKISKIFADGETRFNLFNKENLKKNFAEDDKGDEVGGREEAQEGEGGEGGHEGGEQGGGEGKQGKQEGGGPFGFRNFDKDDAKNFISFILANLRALLAECNGFKINIQDLLLTTYLKTLFSKIGPAELNKLLPDIESIEDASKHIIGHFFDRLLNRNATPKRSDDEQSADDSIAHQAEATLEKSDDEQSADAIPKRSDDEHSAETSIIHAAAISQLNFQLKRNVKSFMAAIVDISLHTDELIGTKEKLANYLDNEYDKAMNIPFGLDKRRIENLEINNALRQILGHGLNSIKGFRTQITKIDEHIDSITEQNIDDKMKQLTGFGLLHNIELGNNSFTYNLPDKFANILKQNQDIINAEKAKDQSAKRELEAIKTLVKEIGMLDKSSETLTDAQKLKFEELIKVVIPSAAKPTTESLADKPATMAEAVAPSAEAVAPSAEAAAPSAEAAAPSAEAAAPSPEAAAPSPEAAAPSPDSP